MVDYVSLYLTRSSIERRWISKQIGVTHCSMEADLLGQAKQFSLSMFGRKVVMNVMHDDEIGEHLEGFSHYAMQEQLRDPSGHSKKTLEMITKVTTVIGCVIEDGLDAEGYIGGFLTEMVKRYKGLMFYQDTIFDSGGVPVIGPLARK